MSSPTSAPACHHCGAALPEGNPSRRDVCASCGYDVRACRNCSFHAMGVANECREPSAERVVDKERANFCEFFALNPSPAAPRPGTTSGEARGGHDARGALDALFRKA